MVKLDETLSQGLALASTPSPTTSLGRVHRPRQMSVKTLGWLSAFVLVAVFIGLFVVASNSDDELFRSTLPDLFVAIGTLALAAVTGLLSVGETQRRRDESAHRAQLEARKVVLTHETEKPTSPGAFLGPAARVGFVRVTNASTDPILNLRIVVRLVAGESTHSWVMEPGSGGSFVDPTPMSSGTTSGRRPVVLPLSDVKFPGVWRSIDAEGKAHTLAVWPPNDRWRIQVTATWQDSSGQYWERVGGGPVAQIVEPPRTHD